jgi:hypothetical protein
MKGAEAIIKTMIDSDVRVCFGNPGTSEMHFVAAPHRPRRRTPQRGERGASTARILVGPAPPNVTIKAEKHRMTARPCPHCALFLRAIALSGRILVPRCH